MTEAAWRGDAAALESCLRRIDGRSYPAYRDLRGRWQLPDVGDTALSLRVDRVQGDPFAAPSRIALVVEGLLPDGTAGLPTVWHHGDHVGARIAVEDWLLRELGACLGGRRRGSGKSGLLDCYRPGPEVVERSAVLLSEEGDVELRLRAGLPAKGRRVLGRAAAEMLLDDLPRAVGALLDAVETRLRELRAHVVHTTRQRALRAALRPAGLVAFVGDGAVLPRISGIDQAPLPDAVPFSSPDSLRLTLETPHGPVEGMGLPAGITVITGGGFHGKSTLLAALQRGHLDHVPGDGRSLVVADPDTVKVRAEDGRRVAGVHIDAFLGTLPGGRSTAPFDSDDASGSTSQAAAIVEAVEAGARVLLRDEDTCATNLMVRDERMRQLIGREGEPITPLVERVAAMHQRWGLSLVLVVGGVGDYLAVADVVVCMRSFVPVDLTARARQLAGPGPAAPGPLPDVVHRVPQRASLAPGRKTGARDERSLRYGDHEVDLRAVEQVLDGAHAATLARALHALHDRHLTGEVRLADALDALEAELDARGLDALDHEPTGDRVWPRRHEIAAALNRFRGLRIAPG